MSWQVCARDSLSAGSPRQRPSCAQRKAVGTPRDSGHAVSYRTETVSIRTDFGRVISQVGATADQRTVISPWRQRRLDPTSGHPWAASASTAATHRCRGPNVERPAAAAQAAAKGGRRSGTGGAGACGRGGGAGGGGWGGWWWGGARRARPRGGGEGFLMSLTRVASVRVN